MQSDVKISNAAISFFFFFFFKNPKKKEAINFFFIQIKVQWRLRPFTLHTFYVHQHNGVIASPSVYGPCQWQELGHSTFFHRFTVPVPATCPNSCPLT
jgi:hypothetical protein